jgi:hypothetical protein
MPSALLQRRATMRTVRIVAVLDASFNFNNGKVVEEPYLILK